MINKWSFERSPSTEKVSFYYYMFHCAQMSVKRAWRTKLKYWKSCSKKKKHNYTFKDLSIYVYRAHGNGRKVCISYRVAFPTANRSMNSIHLFLSTTLEPAGVIWVNQTDPSPTLLYKYNKHSQNKIFQSDMCHSRTLAWHQSRAVVMKKDFYKRIARARVNFRWFYRMNVGTESIAT